MPKSIPIILVVVFLSSIAPDARASEKVEVILDRLTDWLEQEKKLDRKITYKRVSTKRTFDSDGSLEEQEKLLFHGVIVDDRGYERLVEKDGAPISGKDLEEERDREKEFRSKKKTTQEGVELDGDLMSRYLFSLEGMQRIRGRDAHVLSFSPRADTRLPDDRKEDAVLNALEGKIWIDSSEWALVRVDASLKRTVRLGWGLLAALHRVSLKFETKRSPRGGWFPYKMSSFIWGRTLVFKPIRQSESSVFYDVEERRGD